LKGDIPETYNSLTRRLARFKTPLLRCFFLPDLGKMPFDLFLAGQKFVSLLLAKLLNNPFRLIRIFDPSVRFA
jgi:hypothetical protein